jgi:hypothetical protein
MMITFVKDVMSYNLADRYSRFGRKVHFSTLKI